MHRDILEQYEKGRHKHEHNEVPCIVEAAMLRAGPDFARKCARERDRESVLEEVRKRDSIREGVLEKGCKRGGVRVGVLQSVEGGRQYVIGRLRGREMVRDRACDSVSYSVQKFVYNGGNTYHNDRGEKGWL